MKRTLSLLLSVLMVVLLLPALSVHAAEAAAEKHIQGFTLTASSDFITPSAGDTITFPTGMISVTGTTPAGLASGLQISIYWYDCTNHITYHSPGSAVFTPGEWYMYLYVECASSEYVIDYNNENFSTGGALYNITLGGKNFRIQALGSSYIGYSATFEVSSDGVPPMFASHTYTENVNNGDTYSKQFVATGESTIKYSKKSGTIPPGLKLNSKGLLSGTFTKPGTYNFTIKAVNSLGEDTIDCTYVVKDVTRISAFTLDTDYTFTPPKVNQTVVFPGNNIYIADTEPSGLSSALEIETYWYDCTSHTTYYPGSSVKFTKGRWTLYLYVDTVSGDYVIDCDNEHFSYGGDLYNITLGGKDFRIQALGSSYIGYSTDFYVGVTPDTVKIGYDEDVIPCVTDKMTFAEVNDLFLNNITSPMSASDTFEGWYVTTANGFTAFSDDTGAPWDTCNSTEYLEAGEPYFFSFDLNLCSGYKWAGGHNQEFTINGSSDVIIGEYSADGKIAYIVSRKMICKKDISDAVVSGINRMPYTGSEITQSNLKLEMDGYTLYQGYDYTVVYENNVEPGYATMKIYGKNNYGGMIETTFCITEDEDPRTVIWNVEASADIDSIIGYGNTIVSPTFTVSEGEPAYFETGMGGWYRKNGDEWQEIPDGGQFTSGTWRYSCQLRIDNGGTEYVLADCPSVIVDGATWAASLSTMVDDTYCYTYVGSIEFTITGSGLLIFNYLSKYRIDENYVGEPITPFSVAESVDGGTPPYTFNKKGGPAWIKVSKDGTISGTPTEPGENADLIVRVTDANRKYKQITIPVRETALRPSDKTEIDLIVAASDMSEIFAVGKTIVSPTFTVTEGQPVYFETGMGDWYKKDGSDWVQASYGEKFTKGTWKYACQIRIDAGGNEYVISDTPTVRVDGQNWTVSPGTVTGYDYCYTYAGSPEMTLKNPLKYTAEFADGAVEYKGTTPYVVYNKSAQTPAVIVKDKNGNTVDASKYTLTYRDNTNPGTGYVDVRTVATGEVVTLWFKIYLPATTSTSVENTADGILIKWKKVDSAKGYVIYRRAWNLTDSGWTTFTRWNNTTGTTWTDTKVYAGTRYQYGIKAYFNDPMDNYNLGFVGPLKTTVRITTRTLNSVTGGNKQLTVKWSGSSVFTGYQVQIATDSAFTKDVQTVKITDKKTYETTIKSLKANTTYYVRVRSYHKFDGTTYYGGWSNVLSAKTK